MLILVKHFPCDNYLKKNIFRKYLEYFRKSLEGIDYMLQYHKTTLLYEHNFKMKGYEELIVYNAASYNFPLQLNI